MFSKETIHETREELQKEIRNLRYQLEEANETIEAIRTGQVDALVVQSDNGHQLYTLKSADQTYRVFIEKMTEGAVTLSRTGLILYCNSQFAVMVDLPLAKVIGLAFEGFVVPDNKEQYQELFDKCWKADCKGEVKLVAGKSQTPVQLSLTTLELEDGLALSIILTDLTVQKETQKQLQTNNQRLEEAIKALELSNHDLQQFASVASHDLQEPLRKIQVFSNLLLQQQSGFDPQNVRYLQKIIYSSARMRELILEILNYSRLSANDTAPECVDLTELVKGLKDDFELVVQDKGAEIIIGKLPCVEVNKGQIRQVFQNIVSNGLKFSKAGIKPVITISSKIIGGKSFDSSEQADGAYCCISIRDNGIGFDEQYVGNIFALFERLNSKDQYEGTGIGLAIAKKIIDKHNGLITAKSKEGNGAEFLIILPIKQTLL